jgi:hypothetical protein
MTDPHDPRHATDELDPLDELASAHLDGHTTPDEAARVDGDPDLSARVARLEAARAAVRAVPVEPADATRRDAALAAALEAFDAAAPPAPVRAPASVTPLASRWRASRRTLQLAGIAAAVALLALAVPLLGRLDDGSDDDQSNEAATALEEREGDDGSSAADSAAPEDAAAGAPSTTTMAARALADLGAFADIDELADAVRARLSDPDVERPSPQAATTYDAALPCAAEMTERAPAPRILAAATLGGQAVVVVVRDDEAGRTVLDVLDSASCALVTTILL